MSRSEVRLTALALAVMSFYGGTHSVVESLQRDMLHDFIGQLMDTKPQGTVIQRNRTKSQEVAESLFHVFIPHVSFAKMG